MKNARNIYEQLCQKGIIVRDRSKVVLCEDSLRITIGTESENKILIEALNKMG
jgi:histidinol-phosphate aminotransferase